MFLWKSQTESLRVAVSKREQLEDEIADIAVYLFELADNLKIDLIDVMESKLAKNALKYPAEKVRGSSKKYTEYAHKGSKK